MTPYYSDDSVRLLHGDCLDVLREMSDASVDSVVTDPPYALEFMGKQWDGWATPKAFQSWCTEWAVECLRVLKPGGHMLAFGGSRTWHRLASGIEDAGFEIRDSIAWLYGSGFPKSLDVSKAIDKQRDDRPEVLRVTGWLAEQRDRAGLTNRDVDAAFGFNGMSLHWTSQPHRKVAMLPTWEQWEKLRDLLNFGGEMDAEVLRLNGRKGGPGEAWGQREVVGERATGIGTGRGVVPYIGDSDNRDLTAPATEDAKQWEGWGTALKPSHEPVVVARKPLVGTVARNVTQYGTGALNIDGCRTATSEPLHGSTAPNDIRGGHYGSGHRAGDIAVYQQNAAGRWPTNVVLDEHAAAELDRQSADTARFFPVFKYTAKADSAERPEVDGVRHPTVKPLELMRWLVRLVTPPNGVVLDPFAGSGTTGEAAVLEHMRAILVEREPDYLPLIVARLTKPLAVGFDFGEAS